MSVYGRQIADTVACETLYLSMSSSPWMRGVPQSSFPAPSEWSFADLARNPGTSACQRPRDRHSMWACAIAELALDRLGLNDHQAFGPARPPPREEDPEQSIPKTETGATSSAALQHGNLMA